MREATTFNKLFLLVILSCLSIFSYAQQPAGSISGYVYDVSGNPVVKASVSIQALNLNGLTDPSGRFYFSSVVPGEYVLNISAIGYENHAKNITVHAGQECKVTCVCEENSVTLEQVTITAEKREEQLQDVPLAVSAISSKKIQDYRIWSVKDLTSIAPNLYVVNGGSDQPLYSIRGIFPSSLDPSVAVYIDGVLQYDAGTTMSQFYDAERIEVLRGPQGTLYGRNAMAGVINVITKKPGNRTTGFAEASFGNYNSQRYTAGIKTPIVKDKLFAGVSGFYNKSNGYFTNTFDNSRFDKNHSYGGNLYLRYLPSDKWSFTLNGKAQQSSNDGAFPYALDDQLALATPYETSQNATGEERRNFYNASLNIQHYGKYVDITSVSAYQYVNRFIHNGYWDGDWTAYDVLGVKYFGTPKDNYAATFTQELRLSSPADSKSPLKWTAGAFYMNHPDKENAVTIMGADAAVILQDPYAPYELHTPAKLDNSGLALFGQATYSITPKLNITAGLRYDWETKVFHTETNMIKEGFPVTPVVPQTRMEGKYRAFSPKLNIAYKLTSEALLYATYSKGFRAGGLNNRTLDPNYYAYDPEYSNNYEIGAKTTWFDNRMSANLTAFYIDWRDMQAAAFEQSTASIVVQNAGNATSKGVELELAARPFKGMQVDYNLGYTHGRYSRLTQPDQTTGTEKDLKGNQLIMQPVVTSMLAAQYSHPLFKGFEGMVRGEWNYLGKQYFDLENSIKQDPYSLFNVRAGVTSRNVDVIFWARNIFNEKYLSYAYSSGSKMAMIGIPATYGITLTGKF
ncbi:MAG: TonB-dependent receptor [Chitinophagaceae bacterium]|nr:TonB-dependent receptor [Chitinophagaceae bacterium]